MLALRSLRARLLIIGIVPVVVALAVTAVLTVRSVDRFADEQREVKRAEQVRDLRQAATAISKIYAERFGPAFMGEEVPEATRDYLGEAYGGEIYYLPLVSPVTASAEILGLVPIQLGKLPDPILGDLAAGRAVELPAGVLPPALRGEVAIARGVFPTQGGRPFGLLVMVQPAAEVTSPAGALRLTSPHAATDRRKAPRLPTANAQGAAATQR